MIPLIEKIKETVKPIIESAGLEFFDLELKREGSNRILRIIIDKTSGSVSVGDCSKISRSINIAMASDLDNIINEKYYLEVTSPGLDRPLRDRRDFLKFKSKLIKFQTHNLINGHRNYIGRIEEVGNEYVVINIVNNGRIKLGYHEIAKAKLEIEF